MKKIVFGMMIGMTLVYADFSRSAAGVVTDNKTKLQWQDDYNGSIGYKANWAGALDYCHNLPLDGGGWRLPNINELKSIIRDKVTGKPTIDDTFQYKSTSGGTDGYQQYFWSSTTCVQVGNAWSVDFYRGIVDGIHKDWGLHVRCVRDGQ